MKSVKFMEFLVKLDFSGSDRGRVEKVKRVCVILQFSEDDFLPFYEF